MGRLPQRHATYSSKDFSNACQQARSQSASEYRSITTARATIIALPDDLKADIADAVRAFTYMQVMGGTCIVRGLVGHKLTARDRLGCQAGLRRDAVSCGV